MSDYPQMMDFLLHCEDLLITAHLDPDPDCIGSMLGLYHMCGGAKRGWMLVLEDEIPLNLYYLPGQELILKPQQLTRQPQAVLLVDCGELGRASRGWLDAHSDLPFYCIDHHISNRFQGQLAIVEPDASSTGEIIAALLQEARLPLHLEAATCLYSAIIADTGGFRYLNTTSRALALAAILLACGVDKEQIRIQLFESRSPAAMAMLKTAFNNLQVIAEGQLCYTFIRWEEMRQAGALKGDLHNIANYTLHQRGVKVGLFLEEYEDHVKLSLRGRQGWRVDQLAQAWGGGGHVLAAGCSLPGSLETVLPQAIAGMTELLNSTKSSAENSAAK